MTDDLDESLKKLQHLKNRPDGVTHKEWNTILRGVKELRKRKDAPFDPKRHKAETQSDLAKLFIRYYFWTIAGVLVYVPVYNYLSKRFFGDDLVNLRDTFMMVSSAVTPILAFVLGHYFKGHD